MDTARYFDYFGSTDKRWVRIGVAAGTLGCLYVHRSSSFDPACDGGLIADLLAKRNSVHMIICCVQVSCTLCPVPTHMVHTRLQDIFVDVALGRSCFYRFPLGQLDR